MLKYLILIYSLIKKSLYSIALGKNLIKHDVVLANKPRISRKNKLILNGKHIYIGYDCHIGADLIIKNKVLIASNVSFLGGDHRFDVPGKFIMDSGRNVCKQIIIEDDVWIGHGVTVMHGVVLGEGCIIASGSLITKDVPSFTIYGGVPAKKIRSRFLKAEDEEFHREMLRSTSFA